MRIGASDGYFPESAVTGGTGGSAVRELMNQTASGGDSEFDTVTLGKGSALLAQAPLMLPTTKNMHALSAALNRDLTEAFQKAGIPTRPPIEIRVDSGSGRISISADRADAPQIEDKLNSDEKLAESIRTTIAIGSHALGMQRSLAFQSEYLSSDNAAAVVAKYGDLFGAPQNHEISLRFDGSSVEVLRDGQSHA